MVSDERGNDFLELQRHGLELAVQEAEKRRGEIDAILGSERVMQKAATDADFRALRLALIEELSRTSYPSSVVVAAARHLASEARTARIREGRIRHATHRSHWRLRTVAITLWGTAVGLLASGVGMSALGAHAASGKVLVWVMFGLATGVGGFIQSRWPQRKDRLTGTPGRQLDPRKLELTSR